MAFQIPWTKRELSIKINLRKSHDTVVFVSYNGIGDYLYATPAIEAFRKKNPKIKFVLAVSRNYDRYSNPLVYRFAVRNPNFNSVRYFDGFEQNSCWPYNWEDAKREFDLNTTLFIGFDFHNDSERKIHRVHDCFNLFGLEYLYDSAPKPSLFLEEKEYARAKEIWNEINPLNQEVVFLHVDARSFDYHYPYTDELIHGLIERNKKVIVIGSTKTYANAANLLVKDYTMFEIAALLKLFKDRANMVSVNSVFHALSAAVGIKNLGFYVLDASCNSFHYDNLFWLTCNLKETALIPENQIIKLTNTEDSIWNGNRICTFKAKDILEAYDHFFISK